jgi:asparagine synthase (glutamine-hydrolysing)
MSAIVAIVNLRADTIDNDLLRKMNLTLRHRGSDDEGYALIERHSAKIACYAGEDSPEPIRSRYPRLPPNPNHHRFDIGLAHRRFTIADDTGVHQPLIDVDHNCCLIFNGEIYNYRELREELLSLGQTFSSSSDTEVVLEAYKAWGVGCFQKFNGVWAFVLWDFYTKRLIISRDRLGEIPLYWTKCRDAIYVASEIKAILRIHPKNDYTAVNNAAVNPFLHHNRRDLCDSTFFENIHCFPPASWAILDENFPDALCQYWALPQRRLSMRDISVTEAIGSLKHVVKDAVRLRLPANVPWCLELSGGLDTSILVALASEISTSPVVTYTIRYSDQRSEIRDENQFAATVANYRNTDHRVFETTLDNFWHDMPSFTYLMEEPYHSPSVYARHLMQSQMKKAGFKVVCVGTGGDELFGGYSEHFLPAQLENLANKQLLEYVQNDLFWPRDVKSTKKLANLLRRYLALIRKKLTGKSRSQALSEVLRCDFLNNAIPYDLKSNGIPYWVRTNDRARMGLPIQGRAPLCDYRVVELAFSLPSSYLIRRGWHKWILRQAFVDILPEEVVWRRWKSGLQFPFRKCFSPPHPQIRKMFYRVDNQYGDFSHLSKVIQPDFQFMQDNWETNTRLWRAMSFLLWLECFINNPETDTRMKP